MDVTESGVFLEYNLSVGFNPTEGGEEDEEQDEDPMDAFFPEALAGFIMVVTEEGDMIFLTENVNKHIGVSQVQHVSVFLYPEAVFTVTS